MKTLKVTKVTNMLSSNGRAVANQFIIRTENGKYFQSYESIIAFIDRCGNVFLDKKYWKFSKTTSNYRCKFLGEYIKTTRAKIKSGEYKLVDLNNV